MAAPRPATGPDVVAAGAVVARKGPAGPPGPPGAPAEVRRLVVPQGQAGPGRARDRRPPYARCSRRPASRSGWADRCRPSCTPSVVAARRRCTTGSATWSATTTCRATRSTTRSTSSPGSTSTRPRNGSPTLTTSSCSSSTDPAGRGRRRWSSYAMRRRSSAAPGTVLTPSDPSPRRARRRPTPLSPLLHAFGVSRVLSSSSTRCVQTVEPFASEHVVPLEEVDELSEEEYDESGARPPAGHLDGHARGPACCAATDRSSRSCSACSGSRRSRSRRPSWSSSTTATGELVATERHQPL